VGDCQQYRAVARGFAAGCLAALAACSAALPKEEIERYEGFAGDTASEAQYQKAEKFLAAGEPGRALEIARPLREKFPKNVFVHRLYQDSRIGVGEKAALLAEYEELVKNEPSSFSLTMLSRIQTEPEKGALLARQAYELDDRFPWAWYAYGWWNAKLGSDSQQAEAALRRAIDLNPDFLLALRTYAQIRREQELRTAIDGMSRYVERYPQKRSERLLLASLRRGVGGSEVEISAEEFRRLLEERPDDSMAALGLAVAFLELDKWRDAKAIYEKLLLTNPSDPSPEFNLAIVAWDYEHDLPRAAEHFQRYLDKGTDEPFLLQSRARMFLQEIQEKLPPSRPASRPASQP
jgi:tetratricopeptide (TPR) repeat protein